MHVVLAAALVLSALGCSGGAPHEGFGEIHVADLAALRQAPGRAVTVLDADGADFRAREGIIPGAVPLSGYKTYDVAAELPAAKDAPLVFYCADEHWKASHWAAGRAVDAGYTDVRVMVDGLKGWKAAKQPVATP